MPSTKTHTCTDCGFAAKSAGGLTSHKRRHKGESSKPAQPISESSQANICHNCNVLPVGSIELVSLLLVLVFSLSAVLLTSMYALESQDHYIAELEAQLN